jgi:hypothetical protein
LRLAGDLDELATADNDVAPALIDFEDHALDFLVDVIGNIRGAPDVDLAGRQKNVDADIDEQPALDFAGHLALDDIPFVIAGDDHLPGAHPMRFLAGQDDLAGLVFHPFQEDFDVVAGLGRRLVLPFVERDQALGLVPNIHDHLVADDLHHPAGHDAADFEVLTTAQELVELVFAIFSGHEGREFIVADIKFTEQVTIYHSSKIRFPIHPLRNREGMDRRLTPKTPKQCPVGPIPSLDRPLRTILLQAISWTQNQC